MGRHETVLPHGVPTRPPQPRDLVQLHRGATATRISDHRGVSGKTIAICTCPIGSESGDRRRQDALSAAISSDLVFDDDASLFPPGPVPRSST